MVGEQTIHPMKPEDLNIAAEPGCKEDGAFWIRENSSPRKEAVLMAADEERHSQLPCVCFGEEAAWQAFNTVAQCGQPHGSLEGDIYRLYCGATGECWKYCDLGHYGLIL